MVLEDPIFSKKDPKWVVEVLSALCWYLGVKGGTKKFLGDL